MTGIREAIEASIATKESMLADMQLLSAIADVCQAAIATLQSGGKVLFCGNGGSAADAQHLAAELTGRFAFDREPLFAEALHVNTSYLTAVANDYGYEDVFARLVRAKGRPGDILFCISTSGTSPNVVAAARQARELSLTTVGMTGQSGGTLGAHCDHMLRVPSEHTPRIQESHVLIGHIVCQQIELVMFGGESS